MNNVDDQSPSDQAPKLFISYSWTSQDHMDWVVQLATDLRANGVNAVLDKWHLREGQDAHAFMESMVSDKSVSKVILVCDKKYVERADQREGGVGAESQIMSGELYGKVDQTKFVAICRESDDNGRAYLPLFIRSRIYIDFRIDEEYAERFNQLLRWAYDKPFYVEPELGKAPQFLDQEVAPLVAGGVVFDRSTSLSRRSDVGSATNKFFQSAIKSSSDFTAELPSGPDADDVVHQNILALAPGISQIIEISELALQDASAVPVIVRDFHAYLESVLANYDRGRTQWSGDVTKFYGGFLLVAFVALCIRNGRLAELDQFLRTPFALYDHDRLTARSVSYSRLSSYLRSFEFRNERLKLRRVSLHADTIKHVCELIGFEFRDFMQAEFVLFLRGAVDDSLRWWPDSLLYASDKYGAFPWFIKAVVSPYREELLRLVGVSSKSELEGLIERFKTGTAEDPRWSSSFATVKTRELGNLEAILQSY